MASVRLLKNGGEAFPAMIQAVDHARSCIALEMYIFADDRTGRMFREHLIGAAWRGVQVMVLVDAWGSLPLHDSFWDDLREAGGVVRWFRPVKRALFLFRDHRKLLIIDDRTAYIGGLNIADEYYTGSDGELPWRDNALEISGIEVARLRRSFQKMWARAELPLRRTFLHRRRERFAPLLAGGRIKFLESGPEDPMHPVRRTYRQVIHDARRSIDLAMGYFYPHGRTMRAIKRAVRNGVGVRLLFPQKSDIPVARWAAMGLYGRLLRSGVEVWEYTPTMMHAKLAIVDDTVIAGSANMDIRSGRINYELVAVVADPELAARARRDFEEDLKESVRVRLSEWKKRPVTQKLMERVSYCLLARADVFFARLMSP